LVGRVKTGGAEKSYFSDVVNRLVTSESTYTIHCHNSPQINMKPPPENKPE